MFKRILLTGLGLVLLVGLLAGVKVQQFMAMAEMGASMMPPPEVIATGEVTEEQWEQTLRSVGTLEAVRGVTITADFSGRVETINFVSGAEVKKGDLLLQQNIESEQAQLSAAEANLALAKANLSRAKELLTKKVASQSQYDAAEAEFKAAQAQVENVQVTIRKKSVRAPFDGKLGIRQVNLGQDIQQGEPIVTLQTSDPMLVNFNLPQKDLAVLALNQSVRLATDAVPGHIYTGRITAINPEVSARSRNVLVQAQLDNDNARLLPGMFATVEVVMPAKRTVISVPVTAVRYATYGDSVFVIEKTKNDDGSEALIAKQQFVQLGEARGDFVEVLKGVKAGTTVATAGLFKISNGAAVAVNNEVAPDYELSPNPLDR